MYEKTINRWIEEIENWAEGFEFEKELCAHASDPYPPDEAYVLQCDEGIKACARAVDALRVLCAALASPTPDEKK